MALARKVARWNDREGVVVHMHSGVVVKVKSDWWFDAGFTQELR